MIVTNQLAQAEAPHQEMAVTETAVHTEVGIEDQTTLDQIISTGVIIVILITALVIWRLNKQFGGKLKTALMFFISGVFVNFFAALWGSFISHRITVGTSSFDTHNFFMAISTVLFLVSIVKFSELIPRES